MIPVVVLVLAIGLIVGGYSLTLNEVENVVADVSSSNDVSNDNVTVADEKMPAKDISFSADSVFNYILNSMSPKTFSGESIALLSNAGGNSSEQLPVSEDSSSQGGDYQTSKQPNIGGDSAAKPAGYQYGGAAAYTIGESTAQDRINPEDPYSYPLKPVNESYFPFNNINKSEYMLSPNFNDHIFIRIGQDFTDKYAQCVEAGFIPLGNITKVIPKLDICDFSCGLGDSYFDLDSVGIYDYDEVQYYMNHHTFPSETQKHQEALQREYLLSNYRLVDGEVELYVNVNQDFTDMYLQCVECGRFIPLGNVTTPLKDIMICDYIYRFGNENYINLGPGVISNDTAYEYWAQNSLEELYSNPDYVPVHYADSSDVAGVDYTGPAENNDVASGQTPDKQIQFHVVDVSNIGLNPVTVG